MSKQLKRDRRFDVLDEMIQEPVDVSNPLVVPTPQGVHVSPNGAEFPEDLPIEEWVSFGRKLHQVGQSYQWVVADWVRFGERKYGEMYKEALEQTGFSYKTLRNMVSVAGKFELSRRRDNLTPSHHAEVASLSPKQQDRFLEKAEKENWTRTQLRQRVRHTKKPAVNTVDKDHPLLVRAKQAEKYVLRMQEKDVPALNKGEARLLSDVVKEIEQGLAKIKASLAEHHDVQ